MVAILWSKGNSETTIRLGYLWNKFCEKEALCLFCAYPKSEQELLIFKHEDQPLIWALLL